MTFADLHIREKKMRRFLGNLCITSTDLFWLQ